MKSVEIQLRMRIRLPRGRKLSIALLQEAVWYRIRTGRDPRGISIRFLIWKRPGKKYCYSGGALTDALKAAAFVIPISQWVFSQVRGR